MVIIDIEVFKEGDIFFDFVVVVISNIFSIIIVYVFFNMVKCVLYIWFFFIFVLSVFNLIGCCCCFLYEVIVKCFLNKIIFRFGW